MLPKCIACAAGYLVLGPGLASSAYELCGVTTAGVQPAWGSILSGLAILVGGLWLTARKHGPGR